VAFTRITAPDKMSVRVCLYAEHGRITADYRAGDQLVYGAWPPAPAVFSELRHWLAVRCWSCMGYGYIEICHPSTDAVIGHRPCPDLNNPKRHPPAEPVPVAVAVVPAHLPQCTGEGSALCCPPF
jgi:hypothetical protein